MYKTFKSHLGAIEFHGKSRKKIEQEIFAGFLMMTIARLFSNSVETTLNPEESTQEVSKKSPKQANFRFTIQCLGQYIEKLIFSPIRQLRNSVDELLGSLCRVFQKIRPGRKYPRVSKKPRNKWVHRPKKDIEQDRKRSRRRRAAKQGS